jgi:hypothetical protein
MGAPKKIIAESITATVTPTLREGPKITGLNSSDGRIFVQANFSWSPIDERAPKLSTRGTHWSKLNIGHSQDLYDPVNNPNGVVRLTNAHNVSLHLKVE